MRLPLIALLVVLCSFRRAAAQDQGCANFEVDSPDCIAPCATAKVRLPASGGYYLNGELYDEPQLSFLRSSALGWSREAACSRGKSSIYRISP
jgi:hypothetical protein